MIDQIQTHYDDYYSAEGLSEWRRLGAIGKAENIVALCKPFPHSTIVEIGCGDGAVLKELEALNFGASLYGLEISRSGLDALHKKGFDNLIDAKQFDGYNIPYPDDHFDLAVLSHVVEHVEYPRKLLVEAARIARLLFVEVPLEHTLRLSNDYSEDDVGHINFFDRKTIRRLVQTCNLGVIEQLITDTSRELVVHQYGRMGLLRHFVRRISLEAAPRLAQRIFVYHSALLCRRR
ncbi:MAG: hypothetical protein BMS9Abin05_0618 [Rhodothermia bacterium]|nr:MAG: hypothetical protein BMS9Abin05_0618 [Rhodothermia bacterium]